MFLWNYKLYVIMAISLKFYVIITSCVKSNINWKKIVMSLDLSVPYASHPPIKRYPLKHRSLKYTKKLIPRIFTLTWDRLFSLTKISYQNFSVTLSTISPKQYYLTVIRWHRNSYNCHKFLARQIWPKMYTLENCRKSKRSDKAIVFSILLFKVS